MINTLFICREYPPFEVGGVARHAYYLVKHLRSKGVKVHVLSFGDPERSDESVTFVKPKSSIIEKDKTSILRDARIPLEIVGFAGKAEKMLNEGGYDIAHVQEPYVGGLVRYKNKITTIHDTSYGELKAIMRHPLNAQNVKRALFYAAMGFPMEIASIASSKFIIAPSDEVAEELLKVYRVPPRSLKVIWNGLEEEIYDKTDTSRIDARRKLDLPLNKVIVFATSQHVARKRLDVLIEAAKIMKEDGAENIKIIIGGAGPLKSFLKKKANDYGLNDMIVFAGWIPMKKLPLYYRAADIFVMTSEYEAGPMTLLEAAINGAGLISSDIGGFASLLTDGKHALKVRVGDPEQLAKSMRMLGEDKALRQRLGYEARNFAKKFSWSKIAEETKGLYEETLNNG